MSNRVTFKVDQTEFNRVLREYGRVSSRDSVTIVNTKAFYIARRAVAETPKADSATVRKFAGADGGALIGKMINKRRGERGEKGLWGEAMEKSVLSVISA